MKKRNLGDFLTVGIVMSAFFIYTQINRYHSSILDITVDVLLGLLAGAGTGYLAMKLNNIWLKKSLKINLNKDNVIAIEEGEQVLLEGNANHYKGMEAVGGKLYLTNKRVVFKSHFLNIQNHLLSIALDNIKTADKDSIDKGLTITSSTSTERFLVDEPEKWLQLLNQ